MKYVEVSKEKFMATEVDILNLKHGPYKTYGDKKRTVVVVLSGSICRLRKNGVTKYYATSNLASAVKVA